MVVTLQNHSSIPTVLQPVLLGQEGVGGARDTPARNLSWGEGHQGDKIWGSCNLEGFHHFHGTCCHHIAFRAAICNNNQRALSLDRWQIHLDAFHGMQNKMRNSPWICLRLVRPSPLPGEGGSPGERQQRGKIITHSCEHSANSGRRARAHCCCCHMETVAGRKLGSAAAVPSLPLAPSPPCQWPRSLHLLPRGGGGSVGAFFFFLGEGSIDMCAGGPTTRNIINALPTILCRHFLACVPAWGVIWTYALYLLHLCDGCKAHVGIFFGRHLWLFTCVYFSNCPGGAMILLS